MDNYNKKTYELIFFLIISLFLASCSSTSHSINLNQTNDIEIANNFSLEGKFKVSMLDSKETGYFFLKKNNNLIEINIGKNFLVPEEKIVLNINEDLEISKIIRNANRNKLDKSLDKIRINDFIKIIFGFEIDLSLYPGLEIIRDLDPKDKVLPTKIILRTEEYELTILNKNFYE
tara:strand:- start:18 stop:542 length:525 start_codon:yes stop_codon:yes gene_type:complete